MQDKRNQTTEITVEPNAGDRSLLSCNKGSLRSPALDLDTERKLLEQLADILVDIFLAQEDERSSE